ncbi:thioredoxin-like protein [Aspergillus pseudodeflectus]|uniref:Thioredoxin-like protein n=1 Tax=Aspergillus pseudodeflectus TaxID=176178 RepID=A0ABR4KWY6_9EURO
MPIIPIEIISDPICPWCYIGYRTLQRAITLYQKTYPGGSKDTFEISWRPYFIDEVEPEASVLIHDRMARRMTESQIIAAQTRLVRTGKPLGIKFSFGGYIGSSRLAHRVLFLAAQIRGGKLQCRVAEALFKYQFELERDISDLSVVVNSAVEAGIEEGVIREFLAGNGGVEEVEYEAKAARERLKLQGVSGVPCFAIGGEVRFEGVGDWEEFFEAFVAAREVATSSS